jgi:4,5-dihydroxyphthalate decarboxylase
MLELSAAITVNPRTQALLDGTVTPAGIRLLVSPMESAEIFWRQLSFAEFDVSEMSLAGLMMAAARGEFTWAALPVYTLRRFYHTQILVRAGAGIEKPQDLRGKRAGVPEYLQTSIVWARGVIQHEFGVAPAELEWFNERAEDRSLAGGIGFQPPPGLRLSYLRPDQSLDRMLLAGELDALFHYITATNNVDRSRIDLRSRPEVRPLFPDQAAEGRRFYAKTGIFPVNHCVVVRRSTLERYPWVALNIYDAFLASKAVLNKTGAAMLEPYLAAGLLDGGVRSILARDPWEYGFAASRPALETIATYLHEQGLTSRKVGLEEVFAPSALSL